MNYIFIVACIAMIIKVIHRKVDFYSIGAICLMIYNYHCAFGVIYISSHEVRNTFYYFSKIDNRVYFIVLLQMAIIYTVITICDIKKTKCSTEPLINISISKNAEHYVYVLSCAVAWLIMLYNIMRIGITNLTAEKSIIWSQVSSLYVTSNWLGMAVFTYAIRKKEYVLACFGVAPVLLHFFFGSRAYFVAIGIVTLLIYADRIHINKNVIKRILIILLGLIGFIFVMAYKKMYMAIKSGDIIGAFRVLIDPETYAYVSRLGEPRIVLANLNYITEKDIKLGFGDMIDRLVSIVPYLNNIVRPGQYMAVSTILKTDMRSSYGLASSFWGEFYALGSYFFVFIMYLLWIKMLKWGNELIKRTDWIATFWMPLVAYLGFYIHRLDFVKAIGNAKMVFMAMILFYVVSIFVTKKTSVLLLTKRKSIFRR